MNPESTQAWAVGHVCLGVDAGERDVRVVRAVCWGPWRSWAPVERSAAGRMAGTLPVAAGLSTRECLARWIEVPLAQRAKARRVLPSLLDVDLPFPLESCEWGLAALDRTAAKTCRGLAVAARREDLVRRIQDLQAAGLDPDILDSEALAIWTQARQECGVPGAWRIVAQAGADRLTCVVGRNENWVAAFSTLQPQSGALVNWLKSVLPDPADALEWIWAGGGLRDPAGVGRCRGDLEARFSGLSREVERPEYFLARALAFRALSPAALPCNLRSGELTSARHRRRHALRALRGWLTLGLAAGLLVGLNGAWRHEIEAANAALQSRIIREAGALAGRSLAREKGVEVRLAERAVQARAADYLPFERALAAPVLVSVKTVLDLAGALSIQLETAQVEGTAVTLAGSGPDWGACEQFSRRLAEAGFRGRLERRDPSPAGRVGFHIKPEGGS